MDWIEKMNTVIIYIEEHITDALNIENIAKVADCSTYHFQRMFIYMTGIPLSEYIRRRRMSLAVADLKKGDMKIIDVALKYGYHSPTAFNRAFQSVHGLSPSSAKLDGALIKAYSPISFKMEIKGAESLDFRIETKESFRVIGVSISLYGDFEGMVEPVEKIWEAAENNGTIHQLKKLLRNDQLGLFEVMIPDENVEHWRYLISVPTEEPLMESLEEYVMGAYTWAIFSYAEKTIEETQNLGKRVISEWLPTSEYENDCGPDISVHAEDGAIGNILEYWVPIKNKNEGDRLW